MKEKLLLQKSDTRDLENTHPHRRESSSRTTPARKLSIAPSRIYEHMHSITSNGSGSGRNKSRGTQEGNWERYMMH